MDKSIEEDLKRLFENQKAENYCKLIKLAELPDQALTDNDSFNMNLALTKILRYGNANDMANAINYHTQFLHASNELEKFCMAISHKTDFIISAPLSSQVR